MISETDTKKPRNFQFLVYFYFSAFCKLCFSTTAIQGIQILYVSNLLTRKRLRRTKMFWISNYQNQNYSCWRSYQYNEDDFLLLMFWSQKSIFQITSLQVNKEKQLFNNFSLLICLCVSEIGRNWNIKLSAFYWYIRLRRLRSHKVL